MARQRQHRRPEQKSTISVRTRARVGAQVGVPLGLAWAPTRRCRCLNIGRWDSGSRTWVAVSSRSRPSARSSASIDRRGDDQPRPLGYDGRQRQFPGSPHPRRDHLRTGALASPWNRDRGRSSTDNGPLAGSMPCGMGPVLEPCCNRCGCSTGLQATALTSEEPLADPEPVAVDPGLRGAIPKSAGEGPWWGCCWRASRSQFLACPSIGDVMDTTAPRARARTVGRAQPGRADPPPTTSDRVVYREPDPPPAHRLARRCRGSRQWVAARDAPGSQRPTVRGVDRLPRRGPRYPLLASPPEADHHQRRSTHGGRPCPAHPVGGRSRDRRSGPRPAAAQPGRAPHDRL
jgi:hypothetical protein